MAIDLTSIYLRRDVSLMQPPEPQHFDPQNASSVDGLASSDAREESASNIAPDAADVDALLDDVETLAQGIVEDSAQVENLSEQAAQHLRDPANDEPDHHDIAEPPTAPEHASPSALPPVLAMDDDASNSDDSRDSTPQGGVDDEARAILDSLAETGTEPASSNLVVDPNGDLEQSESDARPATEGHAGDEDMAAGQTEDAQEAHQDAAGSTEVAASDAAEAEPILGDLLTDPDEDESDATPTGEVVSAPVVENNDEDHSAIPDGALAIEHRSTSVPRRSAPRLQRVARIALSRWWLRCKWVVRNPLQIIRVVSVAMKKGGQVRDAALLWLDKPFSGLSYERKHTIGIIAIATFIAGGLLWILPYFIYANPFEAMTDGVVSPPQR